MYYKDNKILYNIIGAALVLIVVSITLYYQFNKLTQRSFYDESGKKTVNGITNNAEVVFDSYGVPHITCSNEEDLYFTLGYIHAQDRLWQMDLVRRIAEGRLSEILGKDVLEYDKLFRTVGIGRFAYKLHEGISPKSKQILASYSKGVNEFISQNNRKLPLEFDILNYKPEEWKPEHSLMVIRMMAWQLNLSWMTEFMFGEIANKYGFEKAKDFFPNYPEDGPFIIKDDRKISGSSNTNNYGKNNFAILGRGFFESVISYRNYFGLLGTQIGSNSWVVNGAKTEGGKPILANDPHLVLQTPSNWYEVILKNTGDNSSVCGFSIPGAPGVAIGSNGTISWGITNLMNDDSDFMILKRDTAFTDKYRLNNTLYNIDSTEEYIKIKDIKDEVPLTIYNTNAGPVVSKLEKVHFTGESNFKTNEKEILTLRWTGFEISDEIKAFYDVYHSKNWNEFRSSLNSFGLPASNFTFADVNGNIGYQAAGKVPVREDDYVLNGSVPNIGELEWKGFIKQEDLPSVYNPQENFIVTANNKAQKDLKFYVSNLYEPHYRAKRIEDVLKSKQSMNAQDFKLLQNDVVSLQAKEYFGYLLEAFKDSSKVTTDETKLLNMIKKWDYNLNKLSGLATLFAEFEIQLYVELYKYKLGEKLFFDYVYVNNIPIRNTSKLLKENSSWIIGDSKDSTKNNARDILIRKVFKAAVNKCIERFGSSDPEKWEWGDVHQVIIRHPMGSVPALSKTLNIGPFEVNGTGTTVNNTQFSFQRAIQKQEFECFVGASMRFIFDFNETKFYYSALPSGQSGQPEHRNYANQTKLWSNAEYKKVYLDSEELKRSSEEVKVLILTP
ncbi:MAG: penicillin acylase family protein [Candidatus Kapaibacterium sp.]